ncbi:hypothetical protein [Micromonospora sp. DT47]|uniref:hypothetical protein n=1 Tax=Micromonospora sp. DT47 TaxID=3393431 RepID=UPI003CE79D80
MPLLRSVRVPSLGDGLWSRRLLSLATATAVTALVAATLLRLPRLDYDSISCAVWLIIGAHLLSKRWWPRRDARLVWNVRIAGRDGVEPGLVARRSLAGWVDLVADLVWMTAIGVGVIATLPDDPQWARIARVVLTVGIAAGTGRIVYDELRFTGRVALTASGIRHGRRRHDWTNIDRVTPHRQDGRINGVRLRPVKWLSLEPAPVVGGRDTAVPEARLVAAIEHYRSRPEVLAVGLPVTAPEPTVEPAGG